MLRALNPLKTVFEIGDSVIEIVCPQRGYHAARHAIFRQSVQAGAISFVHFDLDLAHAVLADLFTQHIYDLYGG